MPPARIPSSLRYELRRKLDRHQKVMDIFSTCQCEELPMLRGRRRAPRGSRIAGQSEAPSGKTAMALTRRLESTLSGHRISLVDVQESRRPMVAALRPAAAQSGSRHGQTSAPREAKGGRG